MPSEREILNALKDVIDPEVNIDIVSLGLVEKLEISRTGIRLGLIMTTPVCPMGDMIVRNAERVLRGLASDSANITVEILHLPLWTSDRISPEAKLKLGW
jgi:metal-sulfur cluster biosynthetic enzyme